MKKCTKLGPTLSLVLMALISCSSSSLRENINRVPQSTPTPNIISETTPSEIQISRPTTVNSNPTWENIYFKSIIEREKSSKLQHLKTKSMAEDDIEIRVWSGFGITALRGFILQRNSGEWSALDLDWEVSENRKGERDVKPVDKKLNTPDSGWDSAWQRLVDAGILGLPSAEAVDCSGDMEDGISYVVEIKRQNTYRTYMYDNPQDAKCEQAKQMVAITKIITEEFNKRGD